MKLLFNATGSGLEINILRQWTTGTQSLGIWWSGKSCSKYSELTRRVKFRPGEWFIRPDQPGERVEILRGFIDQVIASLALISSVLTCRTLNTEILEVEASVYVDR